MVEIKSININNCVKRLRRHKYWNLKKTKATFRSPRTSQSKPKRVVTGNIGILNKKIKGKK